MEDKLIKVMLVEDNSTDVPLLRDISPRRNRPESEVFEAGNYGRDFNL